jgi:hypothetical protein
MPDRLYIDKEDRTYYQKAEEENIVNFKNKNQKEQFLLAMAIGFENSQRRELKTREGFFFSDNLGPEGRTLINALAIREHGSADILADEKKVFDIAEQYASAGIRILADSIDKVQFGKFDKMFEKDLVDILNLNQ